MRALRFVLVAALLVTASAAGAGPSRAAANHPAKAARAKTAKPARSAKPTAKVKPVVKAIVADEEAESIDTAVPSAPVKPLPIPATALLTQYQRVGRDLLLLSNERRAQIGVETEAAKLSCAELQSTFRAIKIDDAVKTPESRAAAAAVLAELHGKIERLRGVALTQECLNNPLAAECT